MRFAVAGSSPVRTASMKKKALKFKDFRAFFFFYNNLPLFFYIHIVGKVTHLFRGSEMNCSYYKTK